jgi:hypothetical protein
MDMVDNIMLWKKLFDLDVTRPEIQYDHHMALYQQLKKQAGFNALNIRQKIFLLEKNFHREHKTSHEQGLESDCPPASQFGFVKFEYNLNMKNAICLVNTENPRTPTGEEYRALSTKRNFS